MNKLSFFACLVSSLVIFGAVEARLNRRQVVAGYPPAVNVVVGNGPTPAGFDPTLNSGGLGYGQPIGVPGFGQPIGGPGFGQPIGGPGFGQPIGGPGFGQPIGGPGFGQPIGGVNPVGGYSYQQQMLCMNPIYQNSPQCYQIWNNGGFNGQVGGYGFPWQCLNPFYKMNPQCNQVWNNGWNNDWNNVWNNAWNNGYPNNNQYPNRNWWWNIFGRNAGDNSTQFEVNVNGTNSNQNSTDPGMQNPMMLPNSDLINNQVNIVSDSTDQPQAATPSKRS